MAKLVICSKNIDSFVLLLLGISSVHGSVFLGKEPDVAAEGHMSLQTENFLLTEMEKELGGTHRTFTEKRLEGIKNTVRPIFDSMVKNSKGKLDLPALSYVLHRLFVQRHGWFVKELMPMGKSFAAWNTSNPMQIFGDRVSTDAKGLFHGRIQDGLDIHEISVLAATFEHLVHKESLSRLQVAYDVLKFSSEDVIGKEDVVEILDTYMTIYLMSGSRIKEQLTPEYVKGLRQNVTLYYPRFHEVQQFLREVEGQVLPKRDYIYFSEVMSVVEEVGDRYGQFQNQECLTIKNHLLEIEEKGAGGAGRVRLADFYKARLYNGRYEFSESTQHLRNMGSLDESDPGQPKVIIPNYVNGPSNCLASTSFYQVCCIDECDDLLGHLETNIGKPSATPAEIVSLIAGMPSSTVSSNRDLSGWLLHRLDEVASHHSGQVPLHGRLFAQWMHYAYPRECPYPHAHGETTLERFGGIASKSDMKEVIAKSASQKSDDQLSEESASAEQLLLMHSAMWSMEEELVSHPPRGTFEASADSASFLRVCFRGLIMMATLFSVSVALVRTSRPANPSAFTKSSEKYYV
jgi:hypothetical protein